MQSDPTRRLRTGRIAAAVATLFALSTPVAIANTVTVLNCADSGQGSLRSSMNIAGEGDTVDLRQLPVLGCSTVTLTTGQIAFTTHDLTLLGPDSGVTITGKLGRNPPEVNRIFLHAGYGTFKLEHLNIRDGNYNIPDYLNSYGGCIFSEGTVYLLHTTVQNCVANGSASSRGGGIFSHGLIAKYSTISRNLAGSANSQLAYGGGVYASGQATIKFSTISGNRVVAQAHYEVSGVGGGAMLRGDTSIFASSIYGNYANHYGGGVFLRTATSTISSATITDSTISGNSALVDSGIYSFDNLVLQNSTIAFNTAALGNYLQSPGLAVGNLVPNMSVALQSTLIANNTYAGHELDFSSLPASTGYSLALSGANNLIQKSLSPMPDGTLTNVCPRLGTLRANGGATKTHALLSFSPAIDAGNDVAIDPISHQPYSSDQRGAARVDHGAADIGAYETQQADIVFNDAFDGCG